MPRRTPRDERRRALGQNFLRDPRVVADVIGSLHPPPGGLVVDLGAGDGALTLAAAGEGHRVLAVEVDPHWARLLRSRAAALGDVRVVRGDALAHPLPVEPFHAVSAAPYGIGTAIVRRLLSEAHGMAGAAVILQRETARRLAGRPRAGRFAATWAPWFHLQVVREIPPEAFRPRPSVASALLRVVPRERPLLSPAAFGAYERFLDLPFAGRGRTLRDRLGPASADALAAAGLPRGATPSAVPPDAYPALFSSLRAGGG